MAITTGGASLAAPDSGTAGVARLVAERTLTARGASDRRPTSVQQNVPAWLVFAMFFVALPLSTTWLQERATGTFLRLRSFGVPVRTLLAGKLVPYVAVNLVQVAAMLVVGRWIVPAVGGDALTLGRSPAGLALIAIAVSLAAVSYALLVANVVRTTEQATIVTGVTNLLLGAMGGVMVPRHVMPEALQRLAAFSPMGWGLDGFLDVLLRDGGVREVLPHALALAAFAALALTAAGWRLRRAPVT
jgi:ABC-2 type transport system permease protein